jgi:hypothetical protein
VYVHVLDWPDPAITIPAFGPTITRASMLESGNDIQFSQTETGITLLLPPAADNPIDRVVVLKTRG